MLTQSFSVDIPKIMFKGMYRDYCEAHGYRVPDRNDEKSNAAFNDAIDWLWEEFGDDVCAFLDGQRPDYFEFDDLEWDNDVEVTKASINAHMKSVAKESYGYTEEQLVSSDIIGITYGSLFDATQTMVLPLDNGTTQVQVVSWYDNENSYVSQMVRTIKYFAENC